MATAPQIPSTNQRLLGLDLLRLVAVVGVIGAHMEAPPSDWTSPLAGVLTFWRQRGGRGVELFFVLSGFLVAGLLFAEYKQRGVISVRRFYVRRAWKIYPSFYVLIVFTYLYLWLAWGQRPFDSQTFSELLFLQSYKPGMWNHTWTLSVEEHFYLGLPLALGLLAWLGRGRANPFRSVPVVAAVVALGAIALRWAVFVHVTEYSFYTHVFPTHLRIDALVFGTALAYFYHFHGETLVRLLKPWRYALIGVGFFAATGYRVPMTKLGLHTWGFTMFYVGSAAVMMGVLMCQIPRNRLTVGLAAVGSYSYSIYLWHMAFQYFAAPFLKDVLPWQVRSTLYVATALVLGIAMAKLVETPTLRLRDRWHPSPTVDARRGTVEPTSTGRLLAPAA